MYLQKVKRILLLLALFALPTVHAQLNLDSLWGVFNDKKKPDTVRLMAMWYICYDGYLYNNPDSSFILAQQMYDFAKEKDELQYQGFALGTQGSACFYLGKLDLSIEYHERALKIHQKLGNKGSIGSTLNNIANIYRERAQNVKAIDYFSRALTIFEEMDHKAGIGTIMGNLGAVYADMEDYETSEKWYKRAMDVKRQSDDLAGLALLMTGVGTRYMNQGAMDSAMYYQKEALRIRQDLMNKNGIAFSLKHVGEVFSAINKYDSAMIYFRKSLVLLEELNAESGISDVCSNIADLYKRQGQYRQALPYARRAFEVANLSGYADAQRDNSYLLFELYKKNGNYEKALEMHENYVLMRDSISSVENREAIIRQDFQYDYEKKTFADSLKRAREKSLDDLKKRKESEKKNIIIGSAIGGFVLVTVFLFFVFNRLKITRKQKSVIEEQKVEVEEKNREIMDSITYAKRIQSAILPPDKVVKVYLKESFILYKPKDIVAGDFYWMEQADDQVLFAAADCTGHGVPGAMVSVVCNNALNRSVREYGLSDPGQILDKTREIVIEEFEKSEEGVKDGMDIAICALKDRKLMYAGANNPLWIIRNGEVLETKANKQPIGKFENAQPYTTHEFDLILGDSIYIFSDGFVDQFGGPRGKKFRAKAFRELLLSIQDKPMFEQKALIEASFESWRGEEEQVDDVCVIGVRV